MDGPAGCWLGRLGIYEMSCAPDVFLLLSSVGWGDLDHDLVLSLDQVMAACSLLLLQSYYLKPDTYLNTFFY